jgi:pimeloyl-ACP methyl ester carboxylesterase
VIDTLPPVDCEERIEFGGHAGQTLVGRLSHAGGPAIAVMVHAPGSDKDGGGVFAQASLALRRQGWSCLRFDLTGNGESDQALQHDGNATLDLRAAIALTQALGYRHCALWGLGASARLCLEAKVAAPCRVLMDDAVCASSTDHSGSRSSAAFVASLLAAPRPSFDRTSLLVLTEGSSSLPSAPGWPSVQVARDLAEAVRSGVHWIAGGDRLEPRAA